MFKSGKVFISLVAIILCSLLLTGCGKSKIEKFKEYLVDEAGYTQVNLDEFTKVQADGVYYIKFGDKGYFIIREFEDGKKREEGYPRVVYNFEAQTGSLSYDVWASCKINFVTNEESIDTYTGGPTHCETEHYQLIRSLKATFDGYLAEAGVERLDLLETEEE